MRKIGNVLKKTVAAIRDMPTNNTANIITATHITPETE
jgi:hypothetical protein